MLRTYDVTTTEGRTLRIEACDEETAEAVVYDELREDEKIADIERLGFNVPESRHSV